MRFVLSLLAGSLAITGCAVNAGAGVGARLGERPAPWSSDCDSFDACDSVYEEALANAQHCREEGDDCREEEQNLALSYAVLRDRTRRELAELRRQVEERDAALERNERQVSPGSAKSECTDNGRTLDTTPASAPHGSGWFGSEQPPPAH